MSTKTATISVVVSLVVGIAIGRFTLPAKIVTKTETVEVDKKQSQEDTIKHDNTVTTVTTTKKTDGSVVSTTVTQNNIVVSNDTKTQEQDNRDSKSEKTVTYSTEKWTLSALAVDRPFNVTPQEIAYGGMIQYRILGPIQIGGFILTDKTVGASLGISF